MNRIQEGLWRAQWWARCFAEGAGLPGLLALALGLCGLLLLGQGYRLQADIARLTFEHAHAPAPTLSHDVPVQNTSVVALGHFYDYLPAVDQAPATLNRLLEVGRAAGVALQRGDYQVEDTRQGFLRYRITLPVKGDNQRVLHFVWQALQTFPALALESVTFQREDTLAAQGEAEVRFVLFVRLAKAPLAPRVARS